MNVEKYWLRFSEFLYETYPDLYSELTNKYEKSEWYKEE